MAAQDKDDSLSAALEELLSGASIPPSVRFGEDGLLLPMELISQGEVRKLFGCSARNISYWRGKPWWPGTRDPEPFAVCAHALDAALRGAGLETAMTRRLRKGLTAEVYETGTSANKFEHRGGHRDPRLQAREGIASIAQVLNVEILETPATVSGGVADDLANARTLEARVRQLLEALPSDSLADPTRARVFTALAETSSRILERVTRQEQALLKIQRERGELVEVERAYGMTNSIVNQLLAELGRTFIENCVDALKDLEISTYGTSRIDSLGVEDVIRSLLNDARARAAAALRQRGPA